MTDRKKFLGASDAAAALGLSRWKTPIELWAEKTGQIEPPVVDSEAAELGKGLEDYVAKRFSTKTGKAVHRVNEHRFHKAFPYLAAQIDRKVEGENAVLECKTASGWKAKEWSGEEIPQEYIIQCHHQLSVTGYDKAYLAVLIGNQDFKIREILRDEKIIEDLVKKEIEFWAYVRNKMMPEIVMPKDDDVLYQLFPQMTAGEDVALKDEANILIEGIQAMIQDKIALEDQIDKSKNELKVMLKEAEQGHTKLWRVTWKDQVGSTYTVERKPTRVLRYKRIIKEE